jgi:hypothetical protein
MGLAYDGRDAVMSNARDDRENLSPIEDPWDVFELDEEAAEPEPEYGDFWGEQDDDCDNGRG